MSSVFFDAFRDLLIFPTQGGFTYLSGGGRFSLLLISSRLQNFLTWGIFLLCLGIVVSSLVPFVRRYAIDGIYRYGTRNTNILGR